jgi:hypothetical protein
LYQEKSAFSVHFFTCCTISGIFEVTAKISEKFGKKVDSGLFRVSSLVRQAIQYSPLFFKSPVFLGSETKMAQLAFTFIGTTQQPVSDLVRQEYLTLKNTPMRCLQDLQHQLSSIKIKMWMLKQKSDKELTGWKLDGFPGYDPERDARLREISKEYIRCERIEEDLQEQIEQKLRFEYLKSIIVG